MSVLSSSPAIPTLGALLDRLGGIPAERVRYYPLPGTATEQDVIDIEARENRLCELVDGVLVEKPMGFAESYVAVQIATHLNNFVMPRKLGIVAGADGMMRLFPGLVRIPDVAFVARDRLRGGKVPQEPIPDLVPDLAVEVLSEGNTAREMDQKRQEYFKVGAKLIWIVDPKARTVTVYESSGNSKILQENNVLDGGLVLQGLSIKLSTLFGELQT